MLKSLKKTRSQFQSSPKACSSSDQRFGHPKKDKMSLKLQNKQLQTVTAELLACQIQCRSLIGIVARLSLVGTTIHQSA